MASTLSLRVKSLYKNLLYLAKDAPKGYIKTRNEIKSSINIIYFLN